MRTVAACYIALLLLPAPAYAGPAKIDPPSGKEWFCFEGESRSDCRRLRAECENIRGQFSKQDPDESYGPCKLQKSAAVVTFRVVLKDERRFIATPTFKACERVRTSFLSGGEDYADVSPCQSVDARRSALQTLVPKGSSFYCHATVFAKSMGGIYDDGCGRTVEECRADLDRMRALGTKDSPVEVLMDCERRDMVYATKARDRDGKIVIPESLVLHPDWFLGGELVW
jgi:hypothetical protein